MTEGEEKREDKEKGGKYAVNPRGEAEKLLNRGSGTPSLVMMMQELSSKRQLRCIEYSTEKQRHRSQMAGTRRSARTDGRPGCWDMLRVQSMMVPW